ncbi:MAG: hypothetical protein IKL31_10640 [Ruminococcus sp.]|nr:hypothetical protein [Ruminococcus sp.]
MKKKKNTFQRQAIVCQICNLLMIIILTIITSVILYLLFEDIGVSLFLLPVLLLFYGFIEERFISRIVNGVVEKIVK